MEPNHKFSISTKTDENDKEDNLGRDNLDNNSLSSNTKRRKLNRSKYRKIDVEIFNNNYKTANNFGAIRSNIDIDVITKENPIENVITSEDSTDLKSEDYSKNENVEYEDTDFKEDAKIRNYMLSSRSPSPKNLNRNTAENISSNNKINKNVESNVLSKYQEWVLKTYGDQTKTKTVTEKKYQRIIRTVKGEIPQCAENSKFRFWIRSKGFRLGLSSDQKTEELYVSTIKGYKKVAVVEKFLDIIRNVHIGRGKRGNRHAGQKRTYRAITESYSFLPREAVTKYLLGCEECQRRSDVDCDAKNILKKQVNCKKNVSLPDNLSITDYSKASIPPEKKTLKPKNLFLDNQSKTEPISITGVCHTEETKLVPFILNPHEINNLYSSQKCQTTDNSETEQPEVNNSLIQSKELQINSQNSTSHSTCHSTTLLPRNFHSISEFIPPHTVHEKEQTKQPETPKRPIDLCIKRPNNFSNTNNTQPITKNSVSDVTTTNFRKRKQSSYLIFRYTTSTPETTDSTSKKENTSSSGCESTISRSSDFASESGLEVSPIENDSKIRKPIMQITTTERKINIPLNVPHYDDFHNRLSDNIKFNHEKIKHTVHTDFAPQTSVPASIPTAPINVPSFQQLYCNPYSRDNDQ